MRTYLLLSAVVLGACGDDLALEGASLEVAGAPVLSFYQGWGRAQSGALVAGGQVQISYEEGRLPDCRGTLNDGRPAWSITAFAQIDDGPVASAIVAGHTPDGRAPGPAIFDLPRPGELQVWFQITNRWGCAQHDSDFGRNFRYTVGAAPTASIRFTSDFAEAIEGALRGGGSVSVDYALERLPECRQGYNGLPTWEILAFHRFDRGEVRSVPVTRVDGTRRLPNVTALQIPSGARELELWFLNTDRGGCSRYDSDFGANYRFAIGE